MCELGLTKVQPVIYSSNDGLSEDRTDVIKILNLGDEDEKHTQLKQLLCFEAACFTNDEDRAIVRMVIEGARGSVESFDAFLVDKVRHDPGLLIRLISALKAIMMQTPQR